LRVTYVYTAQDHTSSLNAVQASQKVGHSYIIDCTPVILPRKNAVTLLLQLEREVSEQANT